MKRFEYTKKNVIWSVVSKTATIIFPFLTQTVLIYTLGIEYSGLGSLFTSILSFLSFTELGIGSALIYSMYKPIVENDDKKICALLRLYRKCYMITGFSITVFGIITIPFLRGFISGDIPDNINIYVLYCVVLVNTALGYFVASYRNSILIASQRSDIQSKIALFFCLLTNVIQTLVLLIFKNYYVYTLVLPMTTLLNNIVVYMYTKKNYPNYVCAGELSNDEKNDIKQKVKGLFIQKIGVVVLNSVDTIVISSYLGLTILGRYNGYYFVIQALWSFFTVVESAIIPSVGNSIVCENKEKNYRNFTILQVILSWSLIWICVCLICLYQPFIQLWLGKENMLENGIVILFSILFMFAHVGDVNYVYREACGLWWQNKFVPLFSSLINLSLNIVLVKKIGLYGILISTIVSYIFITWPLGSIVIFKYYFKNMKKWRIYIKVCLKYFVELIVIAPLTYFVCSKIDSVTLLNIITKGILCTIISNLLIILINIKNKTFREAVDYLINILSTGNVKNMLKKFQK